MYRLHFAASRQHECCSICKSAARRSFSACWPTYLWHIYLVVKLSLLLPKHVHFIFIVHVLRVLGFWSDFLFGFVLILINQNSQADGEVHFNEGPIRYRASTSLAACTYGKIHTHTTHTHAPPKCQAIQRNMQMIRRHKKSWYLLVNWVNNNEFITQSFFLSEKVATQHACLSSMEC